MTTVFISGSISIRCVPVHACERINNMVSAGHTIIIGDAAGMDLAVQGWLNSKGSRKVIVYYTGKTPRHNVGAWPTRYIEAGTLQGRARHQVKDTAMANDADFGFMIWDMKSQGTLRNMRMMHGLGKKFLVATPSGYLAKEEVLEQMHASTGERVDYVNANAEGRPVSKKSY